MTIRPIALVLLFSILILSGQAALAQSIVLQSVSNGSYVGIVAGSYLSTGHSAASAVRLERIALQSTQVAFRATNGQFMRAGVGQRTNLMIGSPHIRGWETFQQIRGEGNSVAFMSAQNGRYLTVDDDGRLSATAQRITQREMFRLVPVGGIEQNVRRPERQPAPTNVLREIAGNWTIQQVIDPGRGGLFPLHPNAQRVSHFRIDRTGRINASAGCRTITADIEVDHPSVSMRDLSIASTDCSNVPDSFMAEEHMHLALRNTRLISGVNNLLYLRAINGIDLMVLRRR